MSVTPTVPVGSVLCPTSVTAAKCMLVWRTLPNVRSFLCNFLIKLVKINLKVHHLLCLTNLLIFAKFRSFWSHDLGGELCYGCDWREIFCRISKRCCSQTVSTHLSSCVRPRWILENNFIKQKLNLICICLGYEGFLPGAGEAAGEEAHICHTVRPSVFQRRIRGWWEFGLV